MGMIYTMLYIIPIYHGIYHVIYLICDITRVIYLICDIPWYMDTVYTIPCMVYDILYTMIYIMIYNMWYTSPIYHGIYHVIYLICDITRVIYHEMWYTTVYSHSIYCTMTYYIPWYISSWSYIPCDILVQYITVVYTMWYTLYVIIQWYHTCDIPWDVIYHDIYQVILMCDIPYKTVIYHPGIYHGIYHIWHHTKLSKPICTCWGSNPRLHSVQRSVLPTGPCISWMY